jgi:hypothetical protein
LKIASYDLPAHEETNYGAINLWKIELLILEMCIFYFQKLRLPSENHKNIV